MSESAVDTELLAQADKLRGTSRTEQRAELKSMLATSKDGPERVGKLLGLLGLSAGWLFREGVSAAAAELAVLESRHKGI